jgi:hypothetical protein
MFRWGYKPQFRAVPREPKSLRMEGMKWDLKKLSLRLRKISDHKIEVDPLVSSVDFVT